MQAGDRPLPLEHPFHAELRLLLAPRTDPATNPGPRGNPPADPGALERARTLLQRIVG